MLLNNDTVQSCAVSDVCTCSGWFFISVRRGPHDFLSFALCGHWNSAATFNGMA